MIGKILALGLSAFSFDPSTAPGATHECQAAVIRMGEQWCERDGLPPERCSTIQPAEEVSCMVTDNCAYAAHDPLPGECLFIIIRAMLNGVGSNVCTNDGGPDDCGTVEYVEEEAPCVPES